MTLEAYLADQYNRDLQDVTSIEQVLVEVGGTFARSYDAAKGCWPYQLRANDVSAAGHPSPGTSAMILAAIGKAAGRCILRDGCAVEKIIDFPKSLLDIFDAGYFALVHQLEQAGKAVSATFGDDNPLTISHLTELARGHQGRPVDGKAFGEVIGGLSGATDKIRSLILLSRKIELFSNRRRLVNNEDSCPS